MQSIGITADYGGNHNWYISALFWVMLFYFYIIKNISAKYTNIIIALCIYFSLVGIVHYKPDFSMLDAFYGFINGGILRALAGIGIGYFIGMFYNKTKDYSKQNFNDIKSFALFSFIEICIFIRLIADFIATGYTYTNNITFIIMFSILFILFLMQKGMLSQLLNNKLSSFFGKYSYSIYVMQGISFYIFERTLFKDKNFIENVPLCIFTALIFSVFLGILTHYFIEKPSAKYLKKKFKI